MNMQTVRVFVFLWLVIHYNLCREVLNPTIVFAFEVNGGAKIADYWPPSSENADRSHSRVHCNAAVAR